MSLLYIYFFFNLIKSFLHNRFLRGSVWLASLKAALPSCLPNFGFSNACLGM